MAKVQNAPAKQSGKKILAKLQEKAKKTATAAWSNWSNHTQR
jgi:hypothetical protein